MADNVEAEGTAALGACSFEDRTGRRGWRRWRHCFFLVSRVWSCRRSVIQNQGHHDHPNSSSPGKKETEHRPAHPVEWSMQRSPLAWLAFSSASAALLRMLDAFSSARAAAIRVAGSFCALTRATSSSSAAAVGDPERVGSRCGSVMSGIGKEKKGSMSHPKGQAVRGSLQGRGVLLRVGGRAAFCGTNTQPGG